MASQETNIDRLLKARAEIEEELRRQKTPLTVLFTDVVGSTAYFDRFGDTAGLAMLHRHTDLATHTVADFQGRVIKTIGDSVMAEFPEPRLAVQAAAELQRRLLQLNQTLPPHERVRLRIGIHSGLGFRHGNDVYGDVVNLAARITKHTGPAQILISRAVHSALLPESDPSCNALGKVSLAGKSEKEDLFEVIWTDPETYAELRADFLPNPPTAAVEASGGLPLPLPTPSLAVRLRRPGRWVWASGLLVLILAGSVWWRLARPRTSLPDSSRKTLAVVSLENLTEDRSLDWLDRGVAELLTTNIAMVETLDVISTERMRSLISRRVEGEGRLPASQAGEVAREAHADMFLTGALLKVGPRLRLDLRVQETDSGRIVFSDKVEGEEAQAVFAMVDRVTANLLAKLSLGETAPPPSVASGMTASVEALRAFEEGRHYFDQYLMEEAAREFQRATELDPQFAQAYQHLAYARFNIGDLSGARQFIAQAEELAERRPYPRLQKLLIRGAYLHYDGRLEESDQVLETAAREFPREIEPRRQLVGNRHLSWRMAESKTILEEILRLDERNAWALNLLAYVYGFAGDVPRALDFLNRSAALLPPNDPNPLDTRGDVLVLNGRYEEAIASYRKNLDLNPGFLLTPALKLALTYLHQGNLALAESSAESVYKTNSGSAKAQAASVLGDIEVGRGRLDRAVARYEEAARLYLTDRPLMASMPLLKAGQIYFEQRQPDAALALARRHPSAGAPGLRATAYLLLGDETSAEKEFTALRVSWTPLVGEYMAGNRVAFHRLQAAGYAGRWQEARGLSPRLPGQLMPLFALDAGRSYLETGLLIEAERHLRFLLQVHRFYSLPEYLTSHNFLAYILAQFYLGRIYEQRGQKAEAVNAYQEFVGHFQNSNARLPQIAEARAALQRLK